MYGKLEPSKRSLFGDRRPRLSKNKIQILAAFSELGSNAAPAVPIILQDLQTLHSPYENRLADTLGAIGEPALEPVVAVLKTNDNWMVRLTCLYVISRMGAAAEKTIPALTNLLAHSDDRLRSDIISTLGAIGRDPEIVVPILAHELTASNESARIAAAQAIANSGTNAIIAINELRGASKDPSPRVKVAIASALAAAGDNENAEVCAESVINSKDNGLRQQALSLLVKLDLPIPKRIEIVRWLAENESPDANKTALEILNQPELTNETNFATTICIDLVKKTDREIQETAVKILARLIKDSAREDEICKAIFALNNWRMEKIFTDEMSGEGFMNYTALKHGLHDADSQARVNALNTAGALGGGGDPVLQEVGNALDDPEDSVRLAALTAVGHIKGGFDNSYPTWPLRSEDEPKLIAAAKLVIGKYDSSNVFTLAEDAMALHVNRNTGLALAVLAQQGKASVPTLDKAIHESDWPTVGTIFITVLEMATNTPECFDLAKATLENPTHDINMGASFALRFYNPKPEIAPVLLKLLASTNMNDDARSGLSMALRDITRPWHP